MKQHSQLSWQYYSPTFEYNELFDDSLWAWIGHRSFAYDYVRWAKPKVIVELGTHKGTSFFSMAQAVKDAKLDTHLIAVDSWEGDPHANYYGEEIYLGVQQIKERFYSRLDITLHKMNFDQALPLVPDGSVDLLHIDGFHTFAAVEHDYLSWLPKLSPRATVFFHDTHEHRKGFGVFRFWHKLKTSYQTIEFSHSHGLGVLIQDPLKASALCNQTKIFHLHYELTHEQLELAQELLVAQQRVADLEKHLNHIKNGVFYRSWQVLHRLRNSVRRVKA